MARLTRGRGSPGTGFAGWRRFPGGGGVEAGYEEAGGGGVGWGVREQDPVNAEMLDRKVVAVR